MNREINNPAARLYTVLREAKKQLPESRVKEAWAAVFSIEKTDIFEILRSLIALEELVTKVESEISLLDLNHEIFLKHLPTIRKVLSVSNLDAKWADAKNLLAEEVLGSLEFCSERLGALRPEKVLSTDEFEKIQNEVLKLFAVIDGSDLPVELRSVLLDVTQILQSALVQFRIRGINGLRNDLFIALDRLQRVHSELNKEKADPAVESMFKVLGIWDTVTSVALNTPQLLSQILTLA
jgi:hypothetical protein